MSAVCKKCLTVMRKYPDGIPTKMTYVRIINEIPRQGDLQPCRGFLLPHLDRLFIPLCKEDISVSNNPRKPVTEAWEIANKVSQTLKEWDIRHEICGSLKRGNKQDAGDIDIAVSNLNKIKQKMGITNGGSKQANTSIDGMTVGFYQAEPHNWGAMIMFLTGSGKFNIGMRVYAKAHGFKLNQYSLSKNGIIIASETEEQIFSALGLRYLAPKDREEVGSLWKYKL
jgi:DNA polymerase/3'-5' exonuclease PolX